MRAGWPSALSLPALWRRESDALPAQARRRSFRRVEVNTARVEGLRPFAFAAGAGLAIHLINAVGQSGAQHQQRGMWLVFFILAVCAVYQLRGTRGDTDAPIADGSRIARAGSILRRAMGVLLCCTGVGLLFVGLSASATASGGLGLFSGWYFVAAGVFLMLLGLLLALMPKRENR